VNRLVVSALCARDVYTIYVLYYCAEKRRKKRRKERRKLSLNRERERERERERVRSAFEHSITSFLSHLHHLPSLFMPLYVGYDFDTSLHTHTQIYT
jgi:hypothetical protein